MSLSAITSSMSLFNPSVLIDAGQSRIDVAESMRQTQSMGLYCPHCYRETGELLPVRFRNPDERRPHFYHIRDAEAGRKCRNHNGESEKHYIAKAAIAASLQVHGLIDMSLDKRFLTSPEVTKRKPDIWVTYPNGTTEAHEVQISPISWQEIQQRTRDIKSHGVGSVVWYLGGAAYSKENRYYCHGDAIRLFKLWFEDEMPRWELDVIPQSSKKKTKPVDDCPYSEDSEAVSQAKQLEVMRSKLEGKRIVRHKTLGKIGYVHEEPWNLPSCVDVQWVNPPQPYPVRMPLNLLDEIDLTSVDDEALCKSN